MTLPGRQADADTFRVGTAGWTIPAASRTFFGEGASHLERYASRFNAVEINSSFYRPHQRKTYERWSANVPDDFLFAVKLPKSISHEHRLADCAELIDRFAGEIGGLGEKLGVVLVQLPPSLAYDAAVAEHFFATLARNIDAPLICEPRHASWFSEPAIAALTSYRVARAAADPAITAAAGMPGGWDDVVYHRLHGSPHIYRSSYDDQALHRLATVLAAERRPGRATWCIFDNTADFAATANAIELQQILSPTSADPA